MSRPGHSCRLNGNVRRAIDVHEGDVIDAAAMKALVREAVAPNLEGIRKPKSH